jgi:hypothetical protein
MEDPKNNPSNFLDNLPLSYSVDSDPLIPLTEKGLQKGSETESNESKDSFELIKKSQDSPKKTNVGIKKFRNAVSRFQEAKKNEAKVKEDNSLKFEYKLQDSSLFTITIFKPPEAEPKEQQEEKKEESQRLVVEKDEFARHDLKAYQPKIPKKAFPWTMFGGGLAAIVVFVIIIIKLRRALQR